MGVHPQAGAPEDDSAALYAYNHAGWYVADVLAKAAAYRGAPHAGRLAVDPATVREVLGNPRIALTPLQRADLTAGGIDERLVATLAAALCVVPLAVSADRDKRLVIGVRVDFTTRSTPTARSPLAAPSTTAARPGRMSHRSSPEATTPPGSRRRRPSRARRAASRSAYREPQVRSTATATSRAATGP